MKQMTINSFYLFSILISIAALLITGMTVQGGQVAPSSVATMLPVGKSVEGNWKYQVDDDMMRGAYIYYAHNVSINKQDLGEPYNDSRMEINVRKDQMESNVALTVKGQFNCIYNRPCNISAKFDDRAIEEFSLSNATRDTMSVHDEKDFINKLKMSKHLVIEADLYGAGKRQYEFDVANFKLNS